MEWPDITYTQPDGRRVRVKTFKDPVGEMPYFDEERTVRKRLLYRLRVVYINRGRKKNNNHSLSAVVKDQERPVLYM